MKIHLPRQWCVVMAGAMLAVALIAAAEEPASAPSVTHRPFQSKEFVIDTESPFCANMRATGIFINAHHLDSPAADVINSVKSQPDRPLVTVIICRGPQEQTIKTFWDIGDQFIFEDLFRTPDWNPPPKDTLLWPGFDHPMINYLRTIRKATNGKPAIPTVPMTCTEVWGVPRERPELFDELKWMTMAVIGTNYDGILWGQDRREEEWNRMVQELTDQIKAHAADLRATSPVDWVKAPEGQPVSARTSQSKLFITLLNTDFMKTSDDKKEIVGVFKAGRRQGKLTLSLPPGIIASAAATLDGSSVKLTKGRDGLTCSYDFTSGGEMIIVRIKRLATTQPSMSSSNNPDHLPASITP